MMVLMILGYIFLFLLTILLLVFIIPVDYDLKVSKYEIITLQGRIGWLWSLIKVDFYLASTNPKVLNIKFLSFPISINLSDEGKLENKKKKKPKEQKVKKKKSKGAFPLSKEDFTKELMDVILTTIKDVLQGMKPKKIVLKGVYGFDDPYYTGVILAVTNSLYPLFTGKHIEIYPSFEEAKLEGEGHIQGRVVAIFFIFIILRLILTRPIRRILKKSFNKKKEEKNYVS